MKRKKTVLPAFFVLFFLLTMAICPIAQAARTIDVAFDGIRLPVTQTPGTPPADGYGYPPFYLDVAAEITNNRTFVPLRSVSELLGAKVEWQNPKVLLTYGETTVTLTPGSKQAQKNQTTINLDAAPYVKNGYTMVPIRFVTESFGCQAEYTKKLVNIKTPPLTIGNQTAARLRQTSKASVEYIDVFELKANLFVKNIYETLFLNHGKETEEPEYYGNFPNLSPLVAYWSGNDIYTLWDQNGQLMREFTVYQIVANFEYAPEGTPRYLLLDITGNKWYELPETTFYQLRRWDWTADRYGVPGYYNSWQPVTE